MILTQAMQCAALLLGLQVPAEEPFVQVVQRGELKRAYCDADCRGMYIPLRSRFNGGRYTIVLPPLAGPGTLMHEVAHHVQHLNGVFVPHAGAAGLAESGARGVETRWRRECPQVSFQALKGLIVEGGTPPPAVLTTRAWSSAASPAEE